MAHSYILWKYMPSKTLKPKKVEKRGCIPRDKDSTILPLTMWTKSTFFLKGIRSVRIWTWMTGLYIHFPNKMSWARFLKVHNFLANLSRSDCCALMMTSPTVGWSRDFYLQRRVRVTTCSIKPNVDSNN